MDLNVDPAAVEGSAHPAPGDFDAFVDATSVRLLRSALLLTGDHGRAEDLVQDALARASLRWDRIVGDDPTAYVRRIMLNAYVDWWRRKPWRERSVEALPDEPVPDDAAERYATTDSLRRVLSELTRRERAVVVLRYFDDLTEAEIAQTLAMAPGSVKSTSARVLGKLKRSRHLNEQDDSPLTVKGSQ